MKLPMLSRTWKILRNAVVAICGLAIVVALLPSKARSQLGLDPCCAMMSVGLNSISGLLRNAATVMGNSGDPRCRPVLERLAASSDPGVAAHARWALRRLGGAAAPPDPGHAGMKCQCERMESG